MPHRLGTRPPVEPRYGLAGQLDEGDYVSAIAIQTDPGSGGSCERMMLRIPGALVVDEAGLERHTFRDRKLELFVWSRNGAIRGFELHYGIHTSDEWSMRWTDDEGTTFHRIDPLSPVFRVMNPVLDEVLPVHDLHAEFAVRSRNLEEAIRRVVLVRLSQWMRGIRL